MIGAEFSDSDSWSVNLFQPSVDLDKSGPALGKIGDEITYSVTITNTSSADSPVLNLVSFNDSLVTHSLRCRMPAPRWLRELPARSPTPTHPSQAILTRW